jgi:alpha-glucosidase (family GH31 glycosyl hydrolase)
MFLQFPEDRTTHHLDRQYMLGPSLLVAPVFTPSKEEHEYYLPAGTWTSFGSANQRTIQGPTWIKEHVALDEIPLWVRSGTILLLGPDGIGRPDYEYTNELHAQVYGLADGESIEAKVPESKSIHSVGVVRAERKGGEIKIFVSAGKSMLSSGRVFGLDGTIQEGSASESGEIFCKLA